MIPLSLTINGKTIEVEAQARTLLVDLLRTTLGLTGTHVGCDTSQCGACVVSVNGRSVKSCSVLAVACDGDEITTIEGLAGPDGSLHPMQQTFSDCHGLQCGYCTPGMVMTAVAVAGEHDELNPAQVREELHGNLCRCTGYQNIVAAVIAGADAMKKSA